tara:strand:- start:6857 stop:7699 length:843 start_codon:yes stop_codon:yes gene_type:complete
MVKNKTALLIEGGGQRGVFSFGVIDAFIEANYDPFDFFIGVSNGASVLFWYLIRDKSNNLEKMLFSANKKYFNYANLLSGRDILDFYGLFRDAYEYFHPDLNLLKMNLAGRSFFSVVTDAETGNAEYINYEEEKIIDILVATGTLPVLVRRPSIISGRRFFDGGICDPLPVKKAYEMGARKIVVVRTFPKGAVRTNKLENLIASVFVRKYQRLSKMIINHSKTYNESLDYIKNPPADLKIYQVQPDHKLMTRRNTLDHQILRNDYDLGKAKGHEFLKTFI